jgi:hypothetical protein
MALLEKPQPTPGLERFPGLKVVSVEFNCRWLPYFLRRLDERIIARGVQVFGNAFQTKLTLMPSEYFRREIFASERTRPMLGRTFSIPSGRESFPSTIRATNGFTLCRKSTVIRRQTGSLPDSGRMG